ncbi:hypothetical protein M1O29_03715 [Dehalococcoidia bacterium]|nr:hypothetical protein [Dehalococcoidia bacterium]
MVQAERHTFNDYVEAQEAYFERGWTDGLPIIPPTPDKVAEFLDYAGLNAAEVLGEVPTREVTVTAEHVAINSVMAGCKPEYFPVVVAALRALLDDKGNFHSTTGTLSGAAHALMINGPIRNEINVNCKDACFGPGWRANGTIGRAFRLVVRNVGRGIPGFLDRATFSTADRYSFCFGENEEDSPWEPLHVERGFPIDSSTVTVHSVMYKSVARQGKQQPEAILDSVARTMRILGVGGDVWLGEKKSVVVVVGMEHLRIFAEAGWSKTKMRDYVYPKLVAPVGSGESPVTIGEPEGVIFVAAGGYGMTESWILHSHLSWTITKLIEQPRS